MRGFGEAYAFFLDEDFGPTGGESVGGFVRVGGSGAVFFYDSKINSFSVEGRPEFEGSFELRGPAAFRGVGAVIVFSNLSFNLRVGDFRGALVEQAKAGHNDGVWGIYLDEFADEGLFFHGGSGHLDIVVSDGSGGLEDELGWLSGELGSLLRIFLRAFLLACFMASFMASIRLKGFSMSSGLFSRGDLGGYQRRWGAWRESAGLVSALVEFGVWW